MKDSILLINFQAYRHTVAVSRSSQVNVSPFSTNYPFILLKKLSAYCLMRTKNTENVLAVLEEFELQ